MPWWTRTHSNMISGRTICVITALSGTYVFALGIPTNFRVRTVLVGYIKKKKTINLNTNQFINYYESYNICFTKIEIEICKFLLNQ